MKTKNVTFSISQDILDLLNTTVEKRELSKFVAQALEKALKEQVRKLEAAYTAAEQDKDRLNAIDDWSSLENEGWHE